MHNDTMYLSKDTLSSDNWLNSSTENFIKTAVHEGTHASFGTVSNAMLFNFLSHDADLVSKVKQQAQSKGYNFDAQTLEQINTKLQQGQKLTQQETDLFNEYQDEISAQMAAEVLGNKKFMQRFTLSQRSAAAKVLNRIMAVADALSALKSTKARAEYLRYKTAAKLWTAALAELGAHYSNGNIIFNDKDEENSTQDSANGTQFSLKGTDSNGIEIYETSEDIRSLSNAEKRKLFVQQMRNEFRGRTAKFTVDGAVYYAQFAGNDIKKNVYGDKKSDKLGKQAKLNVSASGDIFDLVENATYWGSSKESGKNISAHKNVTEWDYFVKTVQIDGVKYDELVNVRKNATDEYVYDITLNKKAASSSMTVLNDGLSFDEETTSTDSIRKNSENVNTSDKKSTKFSLKIGNEQISGAVESQGNLVALHNLSEQNLLKVLKLGGFPMPSIAVTKADIPFTDFGDITVVFGRETIDPANSYNSVYERDAWTPTVPRAEYKLNKAKAQKISDRISPYITEYETLCGNSNVRLDTDAMQDYLNGWDGQIAYQYGDKLAMQYAFLRETEVLKDNIAEKGSDINSIIDSETNTRKQAYNDWLEKLFDGIVESKGVRNNVDVFNRAGQRRSFEETHYDYTLENIVKVMRAATPQGDVDSYASADTLAAALAKNFASIEDIKQAENLLSAKNQKEISIARNEYEKAISEIVDSMAGRTTIELSTGAEEVLLELARSKRTSPTAILTYLQKEYKGIYNFNAETAQKISTLFQALSAMETDMFEAKPHRAVALSEIKQVLIPSNTPNRELLQALRENNIPYTLYDRSFDNNTDERTAIIKRMADIRFSLKGTTKDGIEIYETSEEIRSLSNAEKRKLFVQQMRNEFRGRTAKFTVDGETYYARFAGIDIKKNIYGDNNSDSSGRKAKLNIEAEGDIFDLVENAKYLRSSAEIGKKTSAHRDVNSWDYFVKTIKIDGKIYNEIINVRKTGTDEYVYDVSLNEKVVPSPSSSTKSTSISSEETTSTDSIRKNSENVNTSDKKSTKFSLKDSVNKVYYRKKDIRRILDDVVSDLYSDSLVVDMTNKTRDNIIDEYQSKFNNTPQSRHLAIALDMAQFILDNVTATSIFESEYNSERIENATNTLAVLRRYLRRLNLSQADMRSEIKYKHDNNTLKVYARWSHRGGNATTKTAAIRLWK